MPEDNNTVSPPNNNTDRSNAAKTSTRVMDLSAMEVLPGCFCPECGGRLNGVPARGTEFKCGQCSAIVTVVSAQLGGAN